MIESIEVFTGTGGLAMGMQMAGCNHRAVIEWDKDSCDNLRMNKERGYKLLEDWNIIQSDVRLIDYSTLGTGIQLIAGGPPCQPFSLGGKSQAYNDKRDMFPEAVRAVREIQPKAFVFENVKGLLRKSFSTYFNYIVLQLTYPEAVRKADETWVDHLSRLEKMHTSGHYSGLKYNVVYRLLNAANYGVPQSRFRVVIVGVRSDLDAEWSFPEGKYSKEALLYSQWATGEYWDKHRVAKKNRPIPTASELSKADWLKAHYTYSEMPTLPWRTVRDAIGDLPDPRTRAASAIPNHEFRDGAKPYPGHLGSSLDAPSKTIKAGAHGVPGGENTVILDDGSMRYYTVRESARIQTFPDDFFFHGSWTESMRQIGNAVPVELAHIIGSSVVSLLGKE